MASQKIRKWIIQLISATFIICVCIAGALIVMYEKDLSDGKIVMRAIWELEHKYPNLTREEIANIVKQNLQNYERDGLDGYSKYK